MKLKGPRKWPSYRPNEVSHLPGVLTSRLHLCWLTAPEEVGLPMILRYSRRVPFGICGRTSSSTLPLPGLPFPGCNVKAVSSSLIPILFLSQNIPVIRARGHVMESHSCSPSLRSPKTHDRSPATVFGRNEPVKVEAPALGISRICR